MFSYLILFCNLAKSQDIILLNFNDFSQNRNPASTGLFFNKNTQTRISSAYGATTLANGAAKFISSTLSYEKNLGRFGWGGFLQGNKDNTGTFKKLNGLISLAYEISIDKTYRHNLHTGIQFGMLQQSINPNGLFFESQYNESTGNFDPDANSGETYNKLSASSFDAGIGAAYVFRDEKTILNPFVSLSVFHLIGKTPGFYAMGNSYPRRINIQLGTQIHAFHKLKFTPDFLFTQQSGINHVTYGVSSLYSLNENPIIVKVGIYRSSHQFNYIQTGLTVRNLTFNVAYGSASGKSKSSISSNTIEFSVILNISRYSIPSFLI